MKFLKLTMESENDLELTKLLHEENLSSSGSQYDELYNDIKASQTVDQIKEEMDDVDVGDSSNDGDSGDITVGDDEDVPQETGSDSGEPETGEEDEGEGGSATEEEEPGTDGGETQTGADGKDEAKEKNAAETSDTHSGGEKVAVEHHPYSVQILNYEQSLATESAQGLMVRGGRKILGLGIDLVSAIASLGIEYTPRIASSITKGLATLIARTAKLLYVGYDRVSLYLEERERSLSKLSTDIASLKKSLNLIVEDTKEAPDKLAEKEDGTRSVTFIDREVINALKIGADVDFTKNIKYLTKYMSSYVSEVTRISSVEYNNLVKLTDPRNAFIKPSVNDLLQTKVRDLLNGPAKEGYTASSELLDSLSSREVLPGDIRLYAYVPSPKIKDMGELKGAYRSSKVFLGFDNSNYVEIDQVDYMDVKGLNAFIEELENLCELSKQHHNYYMTIRKNKEKLRGGLKNFLLRLSKDEKTYGEKDTMAESFYLKLESLDRLYLTSAMDLHKYVADTIAKANKYVAANLKNLA